MISDFIVTEIANAGLGLVVGSSLFSESSQGLQYVLVKSSAVQPSVDNGTDARKATLEVIVTGWPVAESFAMSEAILGVLDGMTGFRTVGDKTYLFKSVTVKDLPAHTLKDDVEKVTTNFTAGYAVIQ